MLKFIRRFSVHCFPFESERIKREEKKTHATSATCQKQSSNHFHRCADRSHPGSITIECGVVDAHAENEIGQMTDTEKLVFI